MHPRLKRPSTPPTGNATKRRQTDLEHFIEFYKVYGTFPIKVDKMYVCKHDSPNGYNRIPAPGNK